MTLRIAFLDEGLWDYTTETPRRRPLGGTQSAACYLAEVLAAAGQSVTLVSGTPTRQMVRGVDCRPAQSLPWEELRAFDILVLLSACSTPSLERLRAVLDPGQKLILWAQHAADQPAIRNLADPAIAACWDGIAFVSRWQRDDYLRAFPIDPARCRILRNGLTPAFLGMFAPGEDILAAKPWPPVLAYTSTPFRGLDVLLDSFPRIRAAIPGTRLRVFSSLEPYQVTADSDPFTALYQRCRDTEGVEYVGSVSQSELAEGLRTTTCLAYPNRFPETSCIAAMEAMAAGCLVVSSCLGALAETTSGFAHLMPVPADPAEHADRFAEFLPAALARHHHPSARSGQILGAAIDLVNRRGNWEIRARAWLEWFNDLRRPLLADGAAPTVERLLVRVQAELAHGDLDHAADLCRLILATDPAQPDAWRYLAQAECGPARHTAAAAALARAHRIADLPSDPAMDDVARTILYGLARGDDGQSLGQRVQAIQWLAVPLGNDPLLSACREDLSKVAKRLASDATAAGDHQAALEATRVLAALHPEDRGLRIAQTLFLTGMGRHAEALETVRDTLSAAAGELLTSREAMFIVRTCVEEAETAIHRTLTDDARNQAETAERVFGLLGEIAGWLGEDPHPAAMAAQAAALLTQMRGDAEAAGRAAFALEGAAAALLGQRKYRQDRHAEAVPFFRRALALGGGPDIAAALIRASVTQDLEHMLEALHSLLCTGLTAEAEGSSPPGWRARALDMVARIDHSLRYPHCDDTARSRLWGRVRGYDARLAYTALGPHTPVLSPAPPGGRRLYDCFQFNDELELLEVRLAELDAVVDRFVLVEASYTHAGLPKPLHFAENRARFSAFADKIIHVVVEDDPGGFAWEREAYQRDAILRGLGDCRPGDMIVISDADEILRPSVAAQLRAATAGEPALFAPRLDIFLYFLNLKAPEPWVAAAAAPWEVIRQIGPNRARYLAKQGLGVVIADAGWHFTWMGGAKRFLAKLDAFAHREMRAGFDLDASANMARLTRFYQTGSFDAGLVPGMWTSPIRTAIDDSFPARLRTNAAHYQRLGWIAPEYGRHGDQEPPR